MGRLRGCTAYDGIQFQGETGKLTLSKEKILFQQTADPSAAPRTWQWQSLKKYKVVFSADTPEGWYLVKISNHQNKAISMLVPESALLAFQKDMDARMATVTTAQRASKKGSKKASKAKEAESSDAANSQQETEPKGRSLVEAKEPSISAEKAKSMVAQVENIKAARASLTKFDSFDSATSETGSLGKGNKNASKAKEGNKVCEANGSQDEPAPRNSKGKVSLGRAAQVIAQDLFIKPGQQMVKDFVVNPTNNLIVKPANRKIVQPAKDEIEGVAQKAGRTMKRNVVNPAKEKIKSVRGSVTRSKSSENITEGDLNEVETSGEVDSRKPKESIRRSKSDISESIPSSTRSSTGSQDKTAPRNSKGKVTLGRAAQVIAQDLFIKPGQKIVKDFVVNPTNNLIVKPANRKIVQPAKDEIEGVSQKAAQTVKRKVVKPAKEKINSFRDSVGGGKSISFDEAIEIASKVEEDTCGEPAQRASTKKPLLHFLKIPPRRTFDEDDIPSTAAPQAA